MRSLPRLALMLLALLALPAVALAGEPPNQNDPCGSGGRDTCDTTGVGFYRDYRYGVRWFGDFRGALPGYPQAFCIDLRYWYPSASYRYREDAPGAVLKNRDGRVVPLVNRQKMAYAMWAGGRTRTPEQQAAVMLYVHGLMGDGAPGEVDGDAIGPAVAARYRRVAQDAERLHGPYRLEVKLSGDLVVARRATATVRVLSAAGVPLPGLRLQAEAPGVAGVPSELRTDGSGVARIAFTPSSAAGLRLTLKTEPVASTLPKTFTPQVPAAARNGQRLAVPSSQVVTEVVTRPVAKGRVTVTTKATPDKLAVGEQSRDEVTIAGAAPGWTSPMTVRLFGPSRSQAELRCDGEPAFQAQATASGGKLTTPPATLTRPGWYTYQLVIPEGDDYAGVTTPCAVPAESLKVEAVPQVHTVISADVVQPGTAITDLVSVTGLSGEAVTVRAVLYGPFPARDKIACTGAPVWTGTIAAAADGEYRTEPVTLSTPGYYTYQESIDASDLVRGVQTACADAAETTVVVGKPQVVTQVSAQETRPGARITDRVTVSGLGVLTVPVQVELWGPFPSREAIACTGTPFWKGTFTANGDGTYTTEAVTLDRAGYYTYRESIPGQPQNDAATTACGETAETTFARAQPEVTTQVSDQVVRPGSAISDRIRVTGLGKTRAVIAVELFGPFPTKAAIRCTGTPFWTGSVTAEGDGELRSAPVTVPRAGFYTYRERLAGSPLVAAAETACAEVAETSLGAPGVSTGRGDSAARVPAATDGPAPTRLRAPGLGIDAPVSAVGIDMAKGILAVPADIRRTGWWRDGAAPGDRSGTVVIAGHVDSARRGAGAFFRLKDARAGERIQVTTSDGRTRTYRVTGIRAMPKKDLPIDIFAPGGPARLVLVTCGGPFDAAAGHYVDNLVVTAAPA